MKSLLYWAPRILALLYIAFISMFALDSFSEPNWPIALFMHLIPSLILAGVTAIAWKREFVGGILFLALAVAFTLFFQSFVLAAPIFVIGVLLLAGNTRLVAD